MCNYSFGVRHSLLQQIPIVIIATFLISGCGDSDNDGRDDFFKDPSTEPIKSIIKTTVPLAYAASISMQAVNGNGPTKAVVIGGTCGSYPCTRVVTIAVAAGDFPFEFESYSEINVFGLWSSATRAIITTTFPNMYVGSTGLRVSGIGLTPVSMGPNGLKIASTNININVETKPTELSAEELQSTYAELDKEPPQNVEISMGMSGWIIEVDDAGTPTDFSDDSYFITGGSQGVNVTSNANASGVLQLAMVRVEMGPACNLNPVGGDLLLNQLAVSGSSSIIGQAFFFFDNTCDGQANVSFGLGNFIAASGESYPLDLTSP